MDANKPLLKAARLLWPSLNPNDPNRFLGRHNALWQLLGRRVTVEHLEQYLYTKRITPRWMRKIIHSELTARAYAMLQVASEIEREQDGPGIAAGLIGWQKKRAAEAALRSYPQKN